jgi:hypothetical protein
MNSGPIASVALVTGGGTLAVHDLTGLEFSAVLEGITHVFYR